MRIVVIVPTYNERDNIGLLIDALEGVFRGMLHDMNILVVDDESPDGTAEVVADRMRTLVGLHMITGRKEGLGAAYVRGMRHALGVLEADAVMEMDADFSHRPEDVPRLVEALEEGADFVIGSRYVPGGSIPEDWPLLRKLISRSGNAFARHVAGLRGIRDCTAGFRAIRASLLERIDLTGLRVQGYAFQMALLNEAVARGGRIREIPVAFVDRTRGETKLGIPDIAEFLANAWWIRLHNSATFFRFSAVGASGVLVNLGLFTLLLRLGVNKYLASPIAIEASILSNFFLNNAWTFAGRSAGTLPIKGLKFNVVSLLSLLVSYLVFVCLSLLFPQVAPQVHQAAGIVPAMFVNYFLNAYWTFRGKAPATAVSPEGRKAA